MSFRSSWLIMLASFAFTFASAPRAFADAPAIVTPDMVAAQSVVILIPLAVFVGLLVTFGALGLRRTAQVSKDSRDGAPE